MEEHNLTLDTALNRYFYYFTDNAGTLGHFSSNYHFLPYVVCYHAFNSTCFIYFSFFYCSSRVVSIFRPPPFHPTSAISTSHLQSYPSFGFVHVSFMHVFLDWSHVSSLYILEIKPMSKVSFANIFSHTVGALFILLMFSLAIQKLFILMKSNLFILFFMSPALGDISVKILLNSTYFKLQRTLPSFYIVKIYLFVPIFLAFIALHFFLHFLFPSWSICSLFFS